MAGPESRLGYAGQDDLHPQVLHSMPDGGQESLDVHVIVDGGVIATTTAATQFGIYSTFVVPPSGVAMVLPQDPNRQYGYISAVDQPVVLSTQKEAAQSAANQIAVAAGSPASASNTGSQTSPAAGAVIASIALAAGTYIVTWTAQLAGTIGAPELNNFGLFNGATQIETSMNLAAAGNYPQQPTMGFTVVIPAGGATLAVKAIILGTVGAVYTAQVNATPVAPAAASVAPNPQGSYLPAGTTTPPIRHNEAVYAANTSTTTATRVTVMVERGQPG